MIGHVFQDEWWERPHSGCWFGLLWLRKLENEMAKEFEKEKGNSGTFIYENKWN